MSAPQQELPQTPSPARSAAARANGARSRGPVTEAGKARSSRNALKHGLRSQKTVMPLPERQAEYEEFRQKMLEDLEPEGGMQTAAAESIISNTWRREQAADYQIAILNQQLPPGKTFCMHLLEPETQAQFDRYNRCEQKCDRMMRKDFALLRELKLALAEYRTRQMRRANALLRETEQTKQSPGNQPQTATAQTEYEQPESPAEEIETERTQEAPTYSRRIQPDITHLIGSRHHNGGYKPAGNRNSQKWAVPV